ncbi:MAG: alpha,alpha-phosphotrehalase [Fusobacteriaceae bacterium]|nr:alpha,alpha-phosphotrehalase [Fusobacteriaceae bacterium]MBN2838677.1 alpha,alpha-phosphotrehalase [Fusobacteriaceae bacterium]
MKNIGEYVIYQIYPKSFKDTTGSGQGDLRGIINSLDYLEELGIDFIWLTPIYPSPQNDNGYDVADYCNINKDFGTMKDFEKLVEEGKKRNIYIMLDMVFNHTSTEHKWFKEALKGNEKYMNYYIFKEGKNGKEPTNWVSKFGGNTWEYVPNLDKYYLHLFDKTQADLNWENEELREEIYKICNFWLEKGVKGFRLDVINLISKPEIFEDDYEGDGRRFYTDGTKIHEYLKELNKNTFGKYSDVITVGEMSSTSVENCILYSNKEEKELDMTFNFHHLKVDYKDGNKWSNIEFDFEKLKNLFSEWQIKMNEGGGWNALFWCNHDQPRAISRFGNDNIYHRESGKMLATALHMLKGTPYIYQGEEIGMTNAYFDKIDDYRDVESLNYFDILKKDNEEKDILEVLQKKSRDNSRTPMQWNSDINGGFSKEEPWINLNKNYKEINVYNALKDEDSIFYHYKELIKIRKKYDVVKFGDYEEIKTNTKGLYVYKRKYKQEELLVVCNFYDKEEDYFVSDNYILLNSNYKETSNYIRPYEARIYLSK